jgi:hypothetical protein
MSASKNFASSGHAFNIYDIEATGRKQDVGFETGNLVDKM